MSVEATCQLGNFTFYVTSGFPAVSFIIALGS
jgi:hypothetical protein